MNDYLPVGERSTVHEEVECVDNEDLREPTKLGV